MVKGCAEPLPPPISAAGPFFIFAPSQAKNLRVEFFFSHPTSNLLALSSKYI